MVSCGVAATGVETAYRQKDPVVSLLEMLKLSLEQWSLARLRHHPLDDSQVIRMQSECDMKNIESVVWFNI